MHHFLGIQHQKCDLEIRVKGHSTLKVSESGTIR